MSLLTVVAEATTGGFFVGGSSEDVNDYAAPVLAVSVVNSDGSPLGGLGIKNFAVRFLAADQFMPCFLNATVAVANQQVPGLYVLGLTPASAVVPQKKGQKYVCAIAVTGPKGARGQTLTSLELFQ